MKLTVPLLILVAGFVIFVSSGPQPRTKYFHVDMTPELFEHWLARWNEEGSFSFNLSHGEQSGDWYQLSAGAIPRFRGLPGVQHTSCSLFYEKDHVGRIQRLGPRPLGNMVHFDKAPCDEAKILQVWRLIKEKNLWAVRRVDEPCKTLKDERRDECRNRARTSESISFYFGVSTEVWLPSGERVITQYGFTSGEPGFAYNILAGPIPQAMRDIVEYVKKNLLDEVKQKAERVTRWKDGKIVERNWDGPGPGYVCGADEEGYKNKRCPPPTQSPNREP